MNFRRNGKKLFGAGILLLMTVLAGTVAFASATGNATILSIEKGVYTSLSGDSKISTDHKFILNIAGSNTETIEITHGKLDLGKGVKINGVDGEITITEASDSIPMEGYEHIGTKMTSTTTYTMSSDQNSIGDIRVCDGPTDLTITLPQNSGTNTFTVSNGHDYNETKTGTADSNSVTLTFENLPVGTYTVAKVAGDPELFRVSPENEQYNNVSSTQKLNLVAGTVLTISKTSKNIYLDPPEGYQGMWLSQTPVKINIQASGLYTVTDADSTYDVTVSQTVSNNYGGKITTATAPSSYYTRSFEGDYFKVKIDTVVGSGKIGIMANLANGTFVSGTIDVVEGSEYSLSDTFKPYPLSTSFSGATGNGYAFQLLNATSCRIIFTEYTITDDKTTTYSDEKANRVTIGESGNLIVSKPADSGKAAANGVTYHFVVTKSGASEATEEFDLEAGDSKTLSGLKSGDTYVVTQTIVRADTVEDANYSISVDYSKTVSDNQLAAGTAGLTLTNSSQNGDDTWVYAYNILDKNNQAIKTVLLKKGETITVTGLTPGTYTVKPATPSFDLTLKTEKVFNPGEPVNMKLYATKDNPPSLYVRNAYNPTTAILTVSKTVTGSGANMDEEFSFKVTLSGEGTVTGVDDDGQKTTTTVKAEDITTSDGGTDYGMTFTNGVAEFTLKNGESKQAINLPEGLTYTVEETDSKGYTTTYTTTVKGTAGTAQTGTTATGEVIIGATEVAFTNSKDEPKTPPNPSRYGTYKYVHEYYYKDSDGNLTLEGKSSIGTSGSIKLPDNTHYTEADITKAPTYDGKTYSYTSDAYGTTSGSSYSENANMTYVVATESGNQIIILKYVRSDEPSITGAYKYVHEYYLRTDDGDVFEGRSDISNVDGLPLDNTQYTEAGVTRVYSFGDHTYTYDNASYGLVSSSDSYGSDAAMTYVVATEDGGQIIILKYIRTVTPPPDLPDPNDPDSPDEVTVEEDGVPKTYVKVWDPEEEEWVYIPEEDVPLANMDIPETGDTGRLGLWALLAAGSLCGLYALQIKYPLRKKEK